MVSRGATPEKDNPARIAGTPLEAQNYARITVSGKPKERVLKVEFPGITGEQPGGWSVHENELK
jgi:hypothetical protein